LRVTVNVNLHRLRRFREALDRDLRLSSNGPVRRALQQWIAILSRFLTRRWMLFSHGGGNWPDILPETRARKVKRGLLNLIMRATDSMFQAFALSSEGKPGTLSEEVPFGVRLGFGGGLDYPHPGSGTSMAKIAMFHQTGAHPNRVRKIIVPPDTTTTQKMREVMQSALKETAREASAA
jgi:hypothetical protein